MPRAWHSTRISRALRIERSRSSTSSHRVVASTRARIALSVARMDSEGRYRELLWRAHGSGSSNRSVRRSAEPRVSSRTRVSCVRRTSFRLEKRVTRDATLGRSGIERTSMRAAGKREMPPSWRTRVPFEIDRLRSKPTSPGAMDGWPPPARSSIFRG